MTCRVPDELRRHSLSDGVGGQYSTNLDRNRYGQDDQYLSTVIRYDLEFLRLCPCLVDVEIVDAKCAPLRLAGDAQEHAASFRFVSMPLLPFAASESVVDNNEAKCSAAFGAAYGRTHGHIREAGFSAHQIANGRTLVSVLRGTLLQAWRLHARYWDSQQHPASVGRI